MKKYMRKGYYILAVMFSKIVFLMPYKFAVKTGGFLGGISYYLVRKSRIITEDNLRKCFPEKSEIEIKRIAKEVFVNQGKNAFELFSYPKLSREDILKITKIENSEGMKEAFSAGKGVFLTSAHCGNWEIMGAGLAQNGFPTNVIAKKIYIEELNEMLVSLRKSKGVNIILRSEKDSARSILRCLRKNETVGLLIDQDTAVPGVFVDFFSRPAWTPSGLAVLALKTGASVVVALDIRLEDETHKAVVTGPIKMIRSDNFDRDVLENTQMLTKIIENHIREYPSQWVWMHRRWKTVQNGEA